ncbi:hypothetical protein Syun_007575 [Stephania yunnanensis]|uniref:Uncharacterized protein n=1 Tax=Stephania yunnanensis TaxID=152371 RepID=A0AAP0L2E3_9MAGN
MTLLWKEVDRMPNIWCLEFYGKHVRMTCLDTETSGNAHQVACRRRSEVAARGINRVADQAKRRLVTTSEPVEDCYDAFGELQPDVRVYVSVKPARNQAQGTPENDVSTQREPLAPPRQWELSKASHHPRPPSFMLSKAINGRGCLPPTMSYYGVWVRTSTRRKPDSLGIAVYFPPNPIYVEILLYLFSLHEKLLRTSFFPPPSPNTTKANLPLVKELGDCSSGIGELVRSDFESLGKSKHRLRRILRRVRARVRRYWAATSEIVKLARV